jgi:hypothetical protein
MGVQRVIVPNVGPMVALTGEDMAKVAAAIPHIREAIADRPNAGVVMVEEEPWDRAMHRVLELN